MTYCFLGKAFGVPRLRKGLHSLCRQELGQRLSKILTYDNLIKRGFTMAEWRCMCRSSGETMNHLLHATLHMKCGPLYSLCLKFIRWCQGVSLIFLMVLWKPRWFSWSSLSLEHCLNGPMFWVLAITTLS